MSKIVNLNRARKARARDENRVAADTNAAKFGRTKAERIAQVTISDKARKMLDQHMLDEE